MKSNRFIEVEYIDDKLQKKKSKSHLAGVLKSKFFAVSS